MNLYASQGPFNGKQSTKVKQTVGWNVVLATALALNCFAISPVSGWQSDNGDGTFTNSVLYADYPDPDIIRVGDDFYMVSTTFADSPGIVVLHSLDMVNWEIISHAASSLDLGPSYNMTGGATAYRQGFWAASIRHHNGMFYIAVSPWASNARIYYAANPAGPWSYHQLDRRAYDPGLFIDDDGTGYIIFGHGPQSILTLNSTFSAVVSQTDNVIDSGGEGSRVIKRGGYYYLFNANPSVWPFQLRVSRATNIFGPWETGRIVLTATTGGHQGSILQLADGSWYGFVHQDSGAVGRMPRIGPVFWENDWPVFGTPSNRNVMADTYPKPVLGKPIRRPPTSDDFGSSRLGLQWQWNHNPDNTRWSLAERSGFLRLRPTRASGFWAARNTLTQKGQGPQSHGIVRLDISNMQNGDIAGFGTLGKVNGYIHVTVDSAGNKTLGMTVDNRGVGIFPRVSNVPFAGTTLYLRTDLNFQTNEGHCSYSSDGINWTSLGGSFPLEFDITHGTFQGQKYAIFCHNPDTAASAGYVDVDSFTLGATANPIISVRPRGRPRLNAAGTTFVSDNGSLLRGPFASTEWGNPPPFSAIEAMRDLGLNAIHLYGEVFDPNYPAPGSTAPGYALARIDQMVQMTRDAGLYLVLTIGNGANNGMFNYDYVMDFWEIYAPRYKDEPHVIYEIQNEPFAWGPPYDQRTLDMHVDAYILIRSLAPDTPILLLCYAVLASGAAALTDIATVDAGVRARTGSGIDWTKAGLAFHGYAGHRETIEALQPILNAGYPVFMTEYAGPRWGRSDSYLPVELIAELERLEVSWLTFQHIPPNFISSAITDPSAFYDLVNNTGLSWLPDFGMWPRQRGVYSPDGRPWATTGLSGTRRIEAENFDTGGQGIAYNDLYSGNYGGAHRPDEWVDIRTITDAGGGFAVGWISNGEWLEYTIYVTEPGFYRLRLRYATPNNNAAVRVLSKGEDVTGVWTLPSTGGWGNWSAATRNNVFFKYGRQILRIEIINGGFDLDWLDLMPMGAGAIADGTYKLVNRASGLAAEADTTARVVRQNEFSDTPIQRWTIRHRGAGQYSIVSAHNNWSWSTFFNGNNDPLDLAPWGFDGHADRRFILTPVDRGFYHIAVVDRGMSVEIAGASSATGAPAQQHEYAGAAHQQWAILAPAAPAFPTGLIAEWVSPNQIDLSWTASAGAISYNVKRSTVSGGPYTTIATNVAATSFSDTSVAAGARYFYVVSANTAVGESMNSNEASPPNLRAYLKFDETGGATASDATGNGWTGTLVNGPTWAAGRFGNAVALDGANDHVRLPTGVVNGLTDFTIAAWVNLDTISTWSRVFDFGTGPPANMFLTPRAAGTNAVRFAITTGGAAGEQRINGAAALPAGVWTHLAVTLSGNVGILYVNGVEVGRNNSITITPAALGATTLNFIGRSQYPDPHLRGRIDEFRIYADALSSAEVAALHAKEIIALPSPPTGLTATAISSSRIDLTWNAVSGATGYNVKRSAVAGGPYTTIATNVTATSFSDTNVVAGTRYFYVVSANAAAGESPNSNEASALPSVPGLRAHLRFDETSGVITSDATRNGWTGALVNGATFAAGQIGNAVALDGVDDHVTLPSGVVNGLTNFTIAAWVNLDTINPRSRVFDFGTGASVNMFLTPHAGSPNTVRFAITTSGAAGEQGINGAAALQAGVWTHLAVTLSGNVGILYVNGVEVGRNSAMTITPTSLGATTRNFIGRSQHAADPHLRGRVDDFRIYIAALSHVEVAALHAEGLPPIPPAPTGLIATAVSSNQIDLTWNAVFGATSYNVKRSTVAGGPYTTIAVNVAATSFSDTGLAESTIYYYVVSAVNISGESANSTQASAATHNLPPPPAPIMNWRNHHFGSPENTGNAANAADPDGDGIPNLLEYALGANPTLAGDGLDKISVAQDGGFLTLTFAHIGDPNLIFKIEAANNLNHQWTVIHTFAPFTQAGTITYNDAISTDGTAARFIRLRVSLASE